MFLKIVIGIWKLIVVVFFDLVNYVCNYFSSIMRLDGILGFLLRFGGFYLLVKEMFLFCYLE